jgi:hypothetical protein
MIDTRDRMKQPFKQIPTDEDVRSPARAGEKNSAIEMYRQIHNVGCKQASDAVEELADLPRSLPKATALVLSPETQRRVEIVFREEYRAEAVRLLVEECRKNLPFCANYDEFAMERIRFAALKLSRGDSSRLREAVELAKLDWRDLLGAAGFGDDVQAHKNWIPTAA